MRTNATDTLPWPRHEPISWIHQSRIWKLLPLHSMGSGRNVIFAVFGQQLSCWGTGGGLINGHVYMYRLHFKIVSSFSTNVLLIIEGKPVGKFCNDFEKEKIFFSNRLANANGDLVRYSRKTKEQKILVRNKAGFRMWCCTIDPLKQ